MVPEGLEPVPSAFPAVLACEKNKGESICLQRAGKHPGSGSGRREVALGPFIAAKPGWRLALG